MYSFISQIDHWRLKHVSPKQFLLILSLITGILGGLAGVVLKNLIHFIYTLVMKFISSNSLNFLYLILPLVGIFLTWAFVKYIVKDSLKNGVSKVLYSISKNRSVLKIHNTYSSLIGSSITAAFGGSIGLEGPIVITGSAIGSNLGRIFRYDQKSITLLIGCGAAGAIASMFKAPIAGVVFALEVLIIDLTTARLIHLLISSSAGAILSTFFMGSEVLFSFDVGKHPFSLQNIPFYILLGALAGLVSVYFLRANASIEKQFSSIKNSWLRMLTGGVLTSLLIFIFPPLFGEGYSTLNNLLAGNESALLEYGFFSNFPESYLMLILFLFMLIVFKVLAMSTTNGGGGVGGEFAPSLFTGGVLGYLLTKVLNLFLVNKIDAPSFILAGMAGIMAGVMLAPLTAIFLIAEITGGYQLFVPLIITVVVSFLTTRIFEPYSIYHKHLAATGELVTHDKDRAAFNIMDVGNLIETDFVITPPDITLGEFVKLVSKSQRNIFPVVNKENDFLGIIFINDIRHIVFNHELYDKIRINELMYMPKVTVEYDESMLSVAKKFQESDNYNIAVLKNGKYLGFVSRANVFSSYRSLVRDFMSES